MARDQIDMTPLQSRDELVAWLEAGVKPPSEVRIGTEHEKTPFRLSGRHPVAYEGARGIGAVLEGMKLLPVFEALLAGWKAMGFELVPTRALFGALKLPALPRHELIMGEIPGRSGTLALQGKEFLA